MPTIATTNKTIETGPQHRSRIMLGAGIFAVIFGLATLYSGGSVLFVDGEARAAAGDYIPFILWFNFLAGVFYVFAGAGLLILQHWAVRLSAAIAIATVLASAILGIMILQGTGFEMRTVAAMALRSVVWIVIAATARMVWNKRIQT